MKHSFLFLVILGFGAHAQTVDSEWNNFNVKKSSLSVNFGLIQPLMLKGGNVEVDYRYGHLVASYSHGWSLEMADATITGPAKDQNISIHIPYSSGIGIGYSIGLTESNLILDSRLEPKWHKFEASYKDKSDTQKNIVSYTTFTLGVGLYATYLPFAKKTSLMRGFNVSASARYWPRISSSLDGNEIKYYNAFTEKEETHKAANIGIADTPFILNLSVGYLFRF